MRRLLVYILLSGCVALYAKVPIAHPNLGEPTGIAPAYFGPNAFPVPEMSDGRTYGNLRVEIAGDGYFGFEKDWTADVFARVHIPLFTERVNLTVWMPLQEWYGMTPDRQRTCRLQDTVAMRGHEAGDAYVSTDIQIVRARKWLPDMTLRAAIKTASGGSFEKARYYDNPGYFFDLSVGKSLYLGGGNPFPYAYADGTNVELRFAGSAGFLCWQTDNGRQNDAVMYGLQMSVKSQYVSMRAVWSGYVGWENNGDRPMVVKVRLAGHVKGFEPYAEYQYGIKDYPFHMVRVGLAYTIDVPALTKYGRRQQ